VHHHHTNPFQAPVHSLSHRIDQYLCLPACRFVSGDRASPVGLAWLGIKRGGALIAWARSRVTEQVIFCHKPQLLWVWCGVAPRQAGRIICSAQGAVKVVLRDYSGTKLQQSFALHLRAQMLGLVPKIFSFRAL